MLPLEPSSVVKLTSAMCAQVRFAASAAGRSAAMRSREGSAAARSAGGRSRASKRSQTAASQHSGERCAAPLV